MANPDALIIGAGPAGLSCAATMREAGLEVVVFEKSDTVGSVWRRHYDRLALHTDRKHSGLPGLAMPTAYPTYPSRAQVVAYLESYAAHFGIEPSFGTTVEEVRREGDHWLAITARGAVSAPVMVIATGIADQPHRPSWPGIESFRGPVIHSSEYRNPMPYRDKRVLVVGFGNSGGEIALDLAMAGVPVAVSVRSPVQILPRDLLGIPIISWAIFYERWPAHLVDVINAPVLRLAVGRIDDLGLRRASKGPRRMVEEDGKVPVFDIGTLDKIRDRSIAVRGPIDRLTSKGVAFADARFEEFDALICATGYRPDLRRLLPSVENVLDARGMPLLSGRPTSAPGLFFCGQITSATGQLREIGREARRIAALAEAAKPDSCAG